jgi:catechol 2,3-dioxygenase-like lactoylglutathione lyase family enzyme
MSATTMPIDGTRLTPSAGLRHRTPGAIRARDLRSSAWAVESVGITVANLDRAVRFYTEVLSFVEVGATIHDGQALGTLTDLMTASARVAGLRLGEELLELTEYAGPSGRAVPPDSRSNDGWFQHVAVVVSDMGRAYDRLVAHGASAISVAPQRLPDWNPAAGGIEAYYFRDPDGHPLELIQFPPDKGAARWHRSSNRLFLGLDHTSIVVRDTDTSLAYYRDVLGMKVIGRTENFGPEQERLNGVPGCRVRITTLAAESGLKIELLHYVTPTDGRAIDAGGRANDIVHWETTVRVSDVTAAADAVRRAGCTIISHDISDVRSRIGPARGFLSRDPDGHVLRFVGSTLE